jgi:hypothetical protein
MLMGCEQQLKQACTEDDIQHAALLARDNESDLEIGAVCSEIWNAMGRPKQSIDYDLIVNGGKSVWTDGDPAKQPALMSLLGHLPDHAAPNPGRCPASRPGTPQARHEEPRHDRSPGSRDHPRRPAQHQPPPAHAGKARVTRAVVTSDVLNPKPGPDPMSAPGLFRKCRMGGARNARRRICNKSDGFQHVPSPVTSGCSIRAATPRRRGAGIPFPQQDPDQKSPRAFHGEANRALSVRLILRYVHGADDLAGACAMQARAPAGFCELDRI